MNIALWILQFLLGFAFLAAGYNHAFRLAAMSKVPRMEWMAAVPAPVMRTIGIFEMLGGLGIVLPMLTGVQVWLTPLAAALLAVVMLFAFVFHVARKEYPNLVINFVLFALAAFVAYGRYVLVP
jgi:uncharacterized membrane protein YphA (DoxX/SURF4 family)